MAKTVSITEEGRKDLEKELEQLIAVVQKLPKRSLLRVHMVI